MVLLAVGAPKTLVLRILTHEEVATLLFEALEVVVEVDHKPEAMPQLCEVVGCLSLSATKANYRIESSEQRHGTVLPPNKALVE